MGSRSLLAMLKKKEKNRERRTKEKGKPETKKKNSYHCHGLSKLLFLLESIPRNKEEQEASQQKKQKEDVVERGIQTKKKKKKKKNGHIELHSQAACHHRKHQACGTEMVPNSVHSTVVAHLEKTYLNLQHHQNNTGAFKSRNRDESNPAKLAL